MNGLRLCVSFNLNLNSQVDSSQLLDIARGVAYLHSLFIVHNDLKPVRVTGYEFRVAYKRIQDNILIRQPGSAVIADFGSAVLMQQSEEDPSQGGGRGTVAYMAPEAFFGPPNFPCDIFSFAIMALEVRPRSSSQYSLVHP